MTKNNSRVIRYSLSFKQQIVQEIETGGSSVEAIRRRYNIGGSDTIRQWLRKFGRNHLLNKVIRIETMEDQDRLKQLEQENKRLKLALADAHLAKDFLETLVELANDHYQTDLKKSFGDKESKNLKKGTP